MEAYDSVAFDRVEIVIVFKIKESRACRYLHLIFQFNFLKCNHMNTPAVLLIAFNRPESTLRVLNQIRIARPRRFYFACDGARVGVEDDVERVNMVRKLVGNIDWPCDVKTRFLDENVGCAQSCAGAISWFLLDAGEGIILEDDTLPTLAFFRYCAIMLERFRNNTNVGCIAGSNLALPVRFTHGYDFSRLVACWGFATWKRCWVDYEIHPQKLELTEPCLAKLNKRCRFFFVKSINLIASGNVHTWDFQFLIKLLRSNQLTVVPRENLVLNIGFDGVGTHYVNKGRPWWVPSRSVESSDDYSFHASVSPNVKFDRYYQCASFGGASKFKILYLKIARIFTLC